MGPVMVPPTDHDQLPLIRRARHLTTRVLDRTGFVCMVRMNHTQPPFDNKAIRQALWGAIDQTACMQAVVGPAETGLYHVPLGFFAPGTPMAGIGHTLQSQAYPTEVAYFPSANEPSPKAS